MNSVLLQKKQVLFVGRLAKEKQVPELIEIWSLVEKNHPQWELVIVGDGAERPLVEKKIEELHLRQVKLIGKTPDVFLHYRSSQILVLSSAYEGLPLVLIEGLFFGLSEISYNCPMGPNEIIINKENGYVIEYEDRKSFVAGLKRLMQDQNLREIFSQKSLELSSKYTHQVVIQDWVRLFKEIL